MEEPEIKFLPVNMACSQFWTVLVELLIFCYQSVVHSYVVWHVEHQRHYRKTRNLKSKFKLIKKYFDRN